MNSIYVSMLGKFDLLVDGTSVLPHFGNSSKSIMLLKYLILNKEKFISATDLIDMFWSEAEKSASPENALRTMVSRIRSSLANADPILKNCILSENKSYRWNPAIECDVDAFIFEAICKEIQQIEHFDDSVRQKYIQLLDLYEGDLSYTESDADWVVSRSLYLHHLYLKMVYAFINRLKDEKDFETVIQVCRIALDIDTFDETLNLELMMALKEGGQNSIALMQYRHITNAYYKYLGLEPSEKILGFYKDLIKADLGYEADINKIKSNLKLAEESDDGAFICDYSIFKNIYQLQLRNLERQEIKMFLALITVSSTVDEQFEPLMLDNLMQELLAILKLCHRKGDTISRYSSSQYAILLPMINYSNGHIVMNRIKKMFYKKYSNNTVKLIFQFGGLDQD